MKSFQGVLRALLLAGTILLLPALFTECAARTVYVRTPPPAVRVEVRPAPPHAHAVWIAGHWEWRKGKYVWVNGYWVKKRPGYVWVPGHWVKKPRGWVWIKGHWKKL